MKDYIYAIGLVAVGAALIIGLVAYFSSFEGENVYWYDRSSYDECVAKTADQAVCWENYIETEYERHRRRHG